MNIIQTCFPILILLFFSFKSFGQIYIEDSICEDFDSLIVGGYVAQQLGGYWTCWGGGPGPIEPLVTDINSYSPNNSFIVDATNVSLIYQFGDNPISTGQWLYSHYMYIIIGQSGYFDIQTYPQPGVGWNLELYFHNDGTGYFSGQYNGNFIYEQGIWIQVEINYDFNSGFAQVLFDGELIGQFENNETIGGVDYYGGAINMPGVFYDDVCFESGWVITNLEENVMNEIQIYPNPTQSTITIKLPTQPSKNTTLTISNTNGQQLITQPITESKTEIDLTHLPAGIYIVKVWNDREVMVKKIIKQ